jgi:hypothetical protein
VAWTSKTDDRISTFIVKNGLVFSFVRTVGGSCEMK